MSSTNSSYDVPVLDNYHTVVSAFSDFLTVAIHTILYERRIYPQESFISARKYNYPVRQNRHPKVCQWVQDAVAAVEVEMLKVRCVRSLLFFLDYPVQHFFQLLLYSTPLLGIGVCTKLIYARIHLLFSFTSERCSPVIF